MFPLIKISNMITEDLATIIDQLEVELAELSLTVFGYARLSGLSRRLLHIRRCIDPYVTETGFTVSTGISHYWEARA